MQITSKLAAKVLQTVDAGLVKGMGDPVPGKMCVEAAVCFALGLPHSDRPDCVGSAVRQFKIGLNDANWSDDAARTRGLRALAIAQLGSNTINQRTFADLVVIATCNRVLPIALRAAAKLAKGPRKTALLATIPACELARTTNEAKEAAIKARAAATAYAYAYAYATADACATAAAYADACATAYATADACATAAADATAYATATAAACAKHDEVLMTAADIGLEALKALKSPGCEFLYLVEGRP